ncbi:MAG: [protein-PII] uridylyltransferase [Gammaproteobacteria bacterium]|nr:MAG: [protein-PII] uridylyltransferase [Gammaproteobacteria bacterium]
MTRPAGANWRLSFADLPQLSQAGHSSRTLKNYLQVGRERIERAFRDGVPIERLVAARARLVDQLLYHLWTLEIAPHKPHWSLIAVGGYGRGELHPYSDIDLLILVDSADEQTSELISSLITSLWDAGLEISHSVRTLDECEQLAAEDITVATNLMESRLVAGSPLHFDEMRHRVGPDRIWPGETFFQAKIEEQKQRHKKFADSSNALEPNIKQSPGGLRDLHVIGWVLKRHFRVDNLDSLVALNFLTPDELKSLKSCLYFLWRVRFALHLVAGRREERLLFDLQPKVAECLGFTPQDNAPTAHIEQFMKRYYRTVLRIRELNDMLLQLFAEAILGHGQAEPEEEIDADFVRRGSTIAIRDVSQFSANPSLMLKLFSHMANDTSLRHVDAKTLRGLRMALPKIDEHFRQNPDNKELFLSIISSHHGVGRAFFYMKRYGLLKRYLPLFADVTGQMQFDLFHIYTVDEHTLFLLKNLARFADPRYNNEFPLASQIMQNLRRPEILYLAGLFHDIGKGRGGDHAKIGAIEAREFCIAHGLPNEDADLVGWLVRHHLLMSSTAQRKDVTDPEVIAQFAAQVQRRHRLELLYVLTVADIRATNPSLWNSWKDALLKELFQRTVDWLDRPETRLHSRADFEQATINEVRRLVEVRGGSLAALNDWLAQMGQGYVQKYSADQVAWHFDALAGQSEPLVRIRRHPSDGASEILVYCADRKGLFADLAQTLFEEQLSIVSATIHTTTTGNALDTFTVLELNGRPIESSRRLQLIAHRLRHMLTNADDIHYKQWMMPSKLKFFAFPTRVRFMDGNTRWDELEVAALDRPGLLADVARTMSDLGVRIHGARIATFGERAEDLFLVSHSDNSRIDQPEIRKKIVDSLKEVLDKRIGQ